VIDSEESALLEPIPVKKLGSDVIFTDGHTRAFAAFLRRALELKVIWEEDEWDTGELDREAYEICVQWCKVEGIFTIAGLKDRVIVPEDYRVL